MTVDEAQTIARIVSTADDGCTSCIDDLVVRLNVAFRDFKFERTKGEWLEPVEHDPEWPRHWPLVIALPISDE